MRSPRTSRDLYAEGWAAGVRDALDAAQDAAATLPAQMQHGIDVIASRLRRQLLRGDNDDPHP